MARHAESALASVFPPTKFREHAAHRQAVADYLLRTANSRREGAQRVVSSDLVYVERTAEPASSSANYLARTTATSRSGDPPPEDSLHKAFDAFDRWLFEP